VQREFRNGIKKAANVHLIATGIDPASTNYEVYVTIPSAIFELAQIEVMNARADLATRMREHVSHRWVLSKVFGYNEQEIDQIFQERQDEARLAAETEAEAQSMLQSVAQAAEAERNPHVRRRLLQIVDRVQSLAEYRQRKADAHRSKGNYDRFMTAGENRESERRADEKLKLLLQNDKVFARRMNESVLFMRELRGNMRQARRAA
jgi:hypothetical protein